MAHTWDCTCHGFWSLHRPSNEVLCRQGHRFQTCCHLWLSVDQAPGGGPHLYCTECLTQPCLRFCLKERGEWSFPSPGCLASPSSLAFPIRWLAGPPGVPSLFYGWLRLRIKTTCLWNSHSLLCALSAFGTELSTSPGPELQRP